MKSTTKKMFAFLLSVIMVLAMTVTAFAADDTASTKKTTANLNIAKSANAPNATFKAYKVMSATQVGENLFTYTVEESFKPFFENGVNGYTLNSDNEILKDGVVVAGDGEWINKNNTTAADLASKLEAFAIQAGITAMNVPANDLPIGYYVVSETATADKAQVSSKPVLVNLVEDVNVVPKDSKTTLEKNILESGKSVKENTASIGEEIQYEVKTSIPTYAANVDKTKLVFKLTDTFTHLDYQKNLKIYVGDDNKELTEGTDYNLTKNETRTFVAELTADAILAYQGKTLTLKYTAKLAEDAVIGSEGNPNDIQLEYTNNPNQENYTGTLDDKVKTYTYGFKIHKVDKNNETQDMAGAKFAIYDSTGTTKLGSFTYGKDGKIEDATGLIVKDTKDQNYATIQGLKEGSYVIREEQAPQGYSVLANDVVVTITDVKTADGKLSGKGKLTLAQGSNSNDAVVEVNQSAGTASVDLVVKIFNVKGISLPETGAKTAMYCLFGGAALIVLGGFYFGLEKLFSRKRQ